MVNSGFTGYKWTDLQEMIGEFNILQFYLGIKNLPCSLNSPLRKDENPSFGFMMQSDGRITYKDFKTQESGSLLNFLMQYFQLDYHQTIDKIVNDFTLTEDKASKILKSTYRNKKYVSKKTILKVKLREFQDYDYDYWNLYGINQKWLKFGKIKAISHIFVTKEERTYILAAEKFAYVYIENKDNITTYKIYQPYSKKNKWLNNHNESVWDLWEQLPKTGDRLIITSSRKDALCLWANLGIPSTSLQAESYLPKYKVIEELKSRFKKIYVLYDNDFNKIDNWGRNFGKKLSSEYGLTQIEIPEQYLSKDPSDLFKNHKKTIFLIVLNNLLN